MYGLFAFRVFFVGIVMLIVLLAISLAGAIGFLFVMITSGTVGKWMSIVGMALSGVYFIMNKDGISRGLRRLLFIGFVVFAIAFAASIVNSFFPVPR